MAFQRRFDTILALFFICLIINANGSFDDSLHRLDVKQRSIWDVYNVDVETMKGAALHCQPTFCVSWNDSNGFALSFSSNQTAKKMFVDPIALSSEDRYRRCWKGQCAHFEAHTHSLFITYGYVDKPNHWKKRSIPQTPTPSVMTRRLAADLTEPPEGETGELPGDKPGFIRRASRAASRAGHSAVHTASRAGHSAVHTASSAVHSMRSMTRTKAAKHGEKTYSESSSGEKRRPIPEPRGKSKRRSSKEEPESEPSVDALSRKDAKQVIRQQWHDASEQLGAEHIEQLLEAWKKDVFYTAKSAFAKERGALVEDVVDVVVGALTGPHEAAIKVAKAASGTVMKKLAMKGVEKRWGVMKKGKSLAKDAWKDTWSYIKTSRRRGTYFVKHGSSDIVFETRRKAELEIEKSRVSGHSGVTGTVVGTGLKVSGSVAVAMATGAALGAAFSGPLFPLGAVVGALSGAAYTVAKGAAKAYYIKMREKEKMQKLGDNFDEFFGEFSNDFHVIEFDGFRIDFDVLTTGDLQEKIYLCFLVHLRSTPIDPAAVRQVSIVFPPEFVDTFHDQPIPLEEFETSALLGPRKTAEYVKPVSPHSNYTFYAAKT